MSGLMPNEPDTLLVKMTVVDCADYCRAKFPKNPPTRKDGVIRSIKRLLILRLMFLMSLLKRFIRR